MGEVKHKFSIYEVKDEVACKKSLEDKGYK
jgi:hypothetical protein